MIQKDLKIKVIVVASGIFLAGVSKAMVCQSILTVKSPKYFFSKPTPRFDLFQVQDMIPAIAEQIAIENQVINGVLTNPNAANFQNTILPFERLSERQNQIIIYLATVKLSLSSPEVFYVSMRKFNKN